MVEFKKRQPMFNAVRTVCLAISKETSQYAMMNVLVQGEYLVATDGKRLHVATIPANYLVDGQYEVIKCNKTIVKLAMIDKDSCGKFPKWEGIIPDNDTSFKVKSGEMGRFVLAVIGMLARQNVGVNPSYIADLEMDEEMMWEVSFNGNLPVVLATTMGKIELRAVIKPINIDFDEITVN